MERIKCLVITEEVITERFPKKRYEDTYLIKEPLPESNLALTCDGRWVQVCGWFGNVAIARKPSWRMLSGAVECRGRKRVAVVWTSDGFGAEGGLCSTAEEAIADLRANLRLKGFDVHEEWR